MKGKIVPAVFLMLVLLIGFPSSVADFSAFADDDDNDNLRVSAEESKAYKKQKEKAEKAREKAEERKDKLKEKYDREIKKFEEKIKKENDNQKEKYERELKKFEEKVNRLDKDDDHDYDDDYVTEFGDSVEIDYSSKTTVLCHYPPGNPDNAKTLTIGTKAVRAHVYNHGDSLGECGGNVELDLEERDYKLAKKHAKLEELRSKFEQKQIELEQKFADKLDKLTAKYAEKEAKRAAKLMEKVQSGEYYDELIDYEGTLRQFELTFESLTAEPIGQPSEPTTFSASITLVTSSSTDSKGTMKFIVKDCMIGDFECDYGKARTTSRGPGGDKNGLVIIAALDDGNGGNNPRLKAFVTADTLLRPLEQGHDEVSITMHSPQSKITHQWFLGSEENAGTLTVTNISYTTSITDYEESAIYDDDEDDAEDEIEIQGVVLSVNGDSLTVETDDGNIELSVNDETEFDGGFDSLDESMVGLEVDIDAIEVDGKLVATEIEIENDLDDDDLDDDDDEDEDDEEDDEEEDD